METDAYILRMMKERDKLRVRTEKMNEFIKGGKYSLLSKEDKDLHMQQAFYMTNYLDTLNKRLKKHNA